MRKYTVSALIAAGLLAGAASSASAADLGGNCCADLEERIAELEATAARKGNRKVSLTISGFVAEQVTWWDDGRESNVYVQNLGQTLSTHFRMAGSAKISSDHSAGYVLHIEAISSDATGANQNKDDGGTRLAVFESYWYLKSNSMGQISVGQRSSASDNAAILVDGSGSLVPANWVLFEGLSYFTRSNGSKTIAGKTDTYTWGDALNCATFSAGFAGDCGMATSTNNIRYDSPTIAGFSASASYGEDDFWDVVGRYAGEFSGFKLAAAVSYSQVSDEGFLDGTTIAKRDGSYMSVAGYLQHVASGLFAYGAYGKQQNDSLYTSAVANANRQDGTNWYVKGGIRQKWLPYGHSVAYGEYANSSDALSTTAMADGFNASSVTWWGVGLVQEIDAAAMSLWIKYRNVNGDMTCAGNGVCGAAGTKVDLDQFQLVSFGALISF